MDHETAQGLREAIFQRKSVRKYLRESCPEEVLASLAEQFEAAVSPDPGERAALRALSGDRVRGFGASAPNYLALYAAPEPDALVCAAFRLQQVSLWLSMSGYGNCWMGMAKPVAEMCEADGLPCAIALAFGRPSEPIDRRPGEFKRKPLAKITDIAGRDRLLEPVRLAPSAINRQPWFLAERNGHIRLYARTSGLVQKILGNTARIDLGIALCHLWIAMISEDCFGGFVKEAPAEPAPRGCEYVWSARMK